MTAAILCIFARAPVHGTVKRRLAAGIGAVAALEAHVRLLGEALDRLTGIPAIDTELWLAGPAASLDGILQPGCVLRQQTDGDLGERMLGALTDALERAPKAVIVGSDCPDIDAAYVAGACERLDRSDVVIGPAEDGGYGLIGARRDVVAALPALFRGMSWGTATVFETTLARARQAGLDVARLATVWDVDTETDWRRYLRRGAPR